MATSLPAGKTGGASTGFTINRRISAAKVKEITTVENFVQGYRNREDISLLKPATLCPGSFNVLSNVSGRIAARKGYTIDGTESSVVSPIRAPYDWQTSTGYVHHLRAGFISSVLNDGKLQIRYVDTYGALGAVNGVYWLDLLTGLTGTYFSYAKFWDSSQITAANLQGKLLMVNRTQKMWEWNGAIANVSGSTSTSVTMVGSNPGTFAQLGFYYQPIVKGDSTTQYTASLVGTTLTYTYSGTGTNPGNFTNIPIGATVTLPVGNPNVGTYPVTAVGTVGTESFSFSLAGANTSTVTMAVTFDGGYSYNFINNGTVYTYTGGAQTGTLLGVTPSAAGIVVDSPMYQQPYQSGYFQAFTFTNTTAPSTGFTLDVIAVRQSSNQVLLGSISDNLVYLSKAGNYQSYAKGTARVQNEGDVATTVGVLKGFTSQEQEVYVSAGLDEWYETNFTPTTITNQSTGTTTTFETFQLLQLKTAALQGAINQYAITKIKDDVVFISNEPIVNSLGRVVNILLTPQMTDLSYPIVNDINAYNLTDAWCAYNKQFIYVGFPQMGLFRMYNMTNPKDPYWEAPINIALSGVSFVGTTVLGHSYQTSESYIMFNGWSDRATSLNTTGLPIAAQAVFAFETESLRAKRKSFNKFFMEGYISPSTNITVSLFGRSPNAGVSPQNTFTFFGTDPRVLIYDNSSIGLNSLGKNPLAGSTQIIQQGTQNPYFAAINTFVRAPYLDYQPAFSSYGVNQQWEILSFGTNSSPVSENETDISDYVIPTGTIWSEDNQPWQQNSPWVQ